MLTVSDIRNFMQNEGYQAKVDEGDEDTAEISSSADGIPFHVDFYRAVPPDGDLDAFHNFTFHAGMKAESEPNLLLLNQFNSQNRFFKAYTDRGVILVEMDCLVSSEELTEPMFAEAFGYWTTFLREMITSTVSGEPE